MKLKRFLKLKADVSLLWPEIQAPFFSPIGVQQALWVLIMASARKINLSVAMRLKLHRNIKVVIAPLIALFLLVALCVNTDLQARHVGGSPSVILLPWLFDNESRLFCILDVSLPINIGERDIDKVITEAVK